MKTIHVLPLLLFPLVASGQEVTFTQKKPAAGDARAESKTVKSTFEMRVSQGGQVMQTHTAEETEVDKTRVEVHGVDAEGLPNKAKLVVEERSKHSKAQGMAQQRSSPVSGKTYEGSRGDDGVWALTCAGAAAPDMEATELQDELEGIREPGGIGDFLVGKTVKVGEVLVVDPAEAKEIMEIEAGVTIERFSMTLQETREGPGFEVAVFAVEAVMAVAQQGIDMRFTLSGVQVIGVENLWPVSLALKGPIAISGGNPAQGVDIGGEGTMQLDMKATYETVPVGEPTPDAEPAEQGSGGR
jgi:hypothetical protein